MARVVTAYLRATPSLRDTGPGSAEWLTFTRETRGMTARQRTSARNKLADSGFTPEQIKELVPRRNACSRVPGLTPDDIACMIPYNPPTFDHRPENARAAADALVRRHKSVHTQSNKLSHLRNWIKACPYIDTSHRQAPGQAVIEATFRPEITTAKNNESHRRLLERAAEGLEIPEPWAASDGQTGVQKFCERVCAWDAEPAESLREDPLALADVIVGLSARPGEMSCLRLHMDPAHEPPRYYCSGVLKKRSAEAADRMWPLLTGARGCQAQLADLYQEYRAQPAAEQHRQLEATRYWLDQEYGLPLKQLRVIGSELAVEASGARTDTARQLARRTALRHEAPQREAASMHYGCARR
jgi:hypothetical protein